MSPWLVKEEDRYKYGLDEQEVIATNQKAEDVLVTGFFPNPFWHSFQKSVAAVHKSHNEQYIQCFENELRLPLKDFLISSLPNYNKTAALEIVQGMEKIIKEKLDVQNLTCSHVAFPDPERPTERYKYNDGMEQFQISIPAFKDHQATLEAMEYTQKCATNEFEIAEKRQVMCPETNLSCQTQSKEEEAIHCSRRLKQAQDYSIHAGYVYAASEEWRTVATFNGILDWALIRNACLPLFDFLRVSQISGFIEKFGDKYWSPDELKAFTAKCQALQTSMAFNVNHPKSFPPLNENSIYFKSLSRTTGWKACGFNSIRAVVHNQFSTSDEHVFIGGDTQKGKEKISDGGDYGALICNLDVDIKGQAVLIPMAMIWAGNKHGFEGFKVMLRCANVNINAVDGHIRTPLNRAVQLRSVTIAKILLAQENVAIDVKDGKGKTALDYAQISEE
ncbi:hypothetical protein BPOR_0554g00060 [Botrytis porri]|uniref:Uncharacterized protein n=1 Tax=Botrytis porri TaxID=87229 RepID=A0A4Z1KEG2_9HELO|nr:hypothetical protein BPOR_0554g00060 [Botrytis porri]